MRWSPHSLQPAAQAMLARRSQSWAFRVQRANGQEASLYGHQDGRHCVWELDTRPHHCCDAQL
eukprot:12907718-Prorocentrum_lima.AAC.1